MTICLDDLPPIIDTTTVIASSLSAPATSVDCPEYYCPTCGRSVAHTTNNGFTFGNGEGYVSPDGSPLVIPPGPLTAAAFESGMSAVEELKLLKAQVQDVARVCKAVALGDLSQKITVPVQGSVMVQLKDVINTMVDKLAQFAKEVTRVSQEVGSEGKLGGQAVVLDVDGTWRELTNVVNVLAANLTNQVRSIAAVTKAVARGDLSKQIEVEANGEILDLKTTVNGMVLQLRTLAAEVTRVTLEVGSQGKLGGMAEVPGVEGVWRELTYNVNQMCSNLTNQVRSIAVVTTAVAQGDLTQKVGIQVEGEMATLKDTVNKMVDQLSTFASEVTRVALEVGTEGILGGQAVVADVQGTWADLTRNVNNMATNLTNQVRSIAEVTKAVAQGDLTKTVNVDVQGEMLDLKLTVNSMVRQLATLAQEVTRVSLEVGTEGILGGQAVVADVEGTWKILTDNVNLMAMNLTNQVRSIAEVTKAVAQGDLTKKIEVDVRGEILELKETVNGMTESLSLFADEVTRVAREVGTEGRLGAQASVPNVGGTWKVLTDNVNVMATNLTLQVRGIAQATTAVAQGDLTKKVVGVSVSGEILDLVNTINDMLTLDGDLNRSQRESLLLVHSLARSLLLIIDDILDISKIEAGRMTMEQVSYSLRVTVFGILKTLVVRADQNNLDLTYDIDPQIPDQLIGDALRLRQVITNLVGNAIKFTPSKVSKRGLVALSCRLLALDDESVTLEFCVSDTGIGIAKDKLNLIFDTFCQADGSTTREYGGTGLGLSISKRLVSLMNGQMWVESEVGKGSKFFFTITSQISSPPLEVVLQKMAPFMTRTILYIDYLRKGDHVARLIETMGLKAHVVHDVIEVSNKDKCPQVDTILLDVPSMVGPVRELEHLRYIPIVLLSLVVKWCLDNSICAHINTPLSPQDLASGLVAAFESNAVGPVAAPTGVRYDVLLAEDNVVNQKLAVQILNKYGHQVEIAENGALAVDAFKQRIAEGHPFDIILMDVSMPYMGGMEATELIRVYEAHDGLPRTPIIALTAHAMIGDRERCLQAGMDDHITKPLRRADLLNAINKLVGERNPKPTRKMVQQKPWRYGADDPI
ncbi:hypothetical protein M422DRAFT_176970 [Sphaerobolus stellatus SS14]|uniref:histidine kinase n=1 Tax=Sphaerobolus stellatus (strain SS14) TaxID=990650 RepID=A0A0C9U595_SPHS4|nr:hypothetical protein M422DRAFT_176970 [Sphaerobolus stellatus SS14]